MSDIVLRVAMKAVIVNREGKILILREAKTYVEGTNHGRYHMPGGRINLGENFEDGLKREVKEETGMDITINYPIHVGEWRPIINGVTNQIVATFMVCQPKDTGGLRLSEEHDDYQWIDPENYTQDVMSPEDKVLERYTEWHKRLKGQVNYEDH